MSDTLIDEEIDLERLHEDALACFAKKPVPCPNEVEWIATCPACGVARLYCSAHKLRWHQMIEIAMVSPSPGRVTITCSACMTDLAPPGPVWRPI